MHFLNILLSIGVESDFVSLYIWRSDDRSATVRQKDRGAPDPDPDPAGYPVDLVDPVQIRIRPDPTSQDPVWIRIRPDPR